MGLKENGEDIGRNCLYHGAIEGQMTEEKGVRRRTAPDDSRNMRRYWYLKEEAKD